MRKWILGAVAFLAFASLAWAQSLCTVTGNIKNLVGATAGSGTIYFSVANYAGPVYIAGTGVVAKTRVTGTVAADGSFSVSLLGNDSLSPANTLYDVRIVSTGGTYEALYSITGASFSLNTAIPAGTPAAPVFLSQAGTLSGSNVWTGLNTFNAGITGVGTLGALTAGTGLLGTVNTWTATQQFNGNATFNGSATFGAQLIPFQINYSETVAPSGQANSDTVYGDSTLHELLSNYNNGGFFRIPQVIASGTSTMTSGAITAATCQTAITSTATGTATTDAIEWSYATAPTLTTDALLHVSPYVTSGNVNFTRCNPTAGSITGTAIVINWRVIR